MRLRKYLKLCYEAGFDHGLAGQPPDPWNPGPVVCRFGPLPPYNRWAYEAGHSDGRIEFGRFAAATKKIIEETA